jgi:GntR family transcriptional repressor for pyruvate dehydrogenase complex
VSEGSERNRQHSNAAGGKSVLEPVKKIRLYESIVKQIQKLITSGTLQPGDKLPPERELAEELGVSRTSIREALRALEMMGYLESRVGVGGGTYIKEVTFSNIISPFSEALLQHDEFIVELLEVRLVLEIEVVRLAAVRRDEEHIRKLDEAIRRMEQDISENGTGLNADNDFHAILADAANNRVLHEFVRLCGDLLEVEREEHLRTRAEEPRRALEQHRQILEAVRRQDSEDAQRLMEDHILKVSEVIKSNRAQRHEHAEES